MILRYRKILVVFLGIQYNPTVHPAVFRWRQPQNRVSEGKHLCADGQP